MLYVNTSGRHPGLTVPMIIITFVPHQTDKGRDSTPWYEMGAVLAQCSAICRNILICISRHHCHACSKRSSWLKAIEHQVAKLMTSGHGHWYVSMRSNVQMFSFEHIFWKRI